MIEKTTAYRTSSGVYPTIEEAQKAELISLFNPTSATETAEEILNHKDAILDILTMKPSSKPRARAINGGKKTRKAKELPELKAALEAAEQKA